MVERGGGSIVLTSSCAGVTGVPGAVAYVATKHALIGVMRTAAMEYAPKGIRVNTVNPGPIETPMMRELEAGFNPAGPGGRRDLPQEHDAAEPLRHRCGGRRADVLARLGRQRLRHGRRVRARRRDAARMNDRPQGLARRRRRRGGHDPLRQAAGHHQQGTGARGRRDGSGRRRGGQGAHRGGLRGQFHGRHAHRPGGYPRPGDPGCHGHRHHPHLQRRERLREFVERVPPGLGRGGLGSVRLRARGGLREALPRREEALVRGAERCHGRGVGAWPS